VPIVVHARAAAVAGAALLLAATTANTASAASSAPSGPYVALGDSYVSGPLIPNQVDLGCLRSDHNYPSLVAAALGSTSLTDVSCAGATTKEMTTSQIDGLIAVNPPQLDAVTAGTRLVSLGIGGNDIGFTDIILTCAGESLISPFGSPCTAHYTAGGTDQLAAAIAATAPKVAATLQAVHEQAPQAEVVVVGYPDILPEHGGGCWPLEPIAYGDVSYLRATEKRLNAMLAAQAAANGAVYVDTYTPTIGHDICQAPGTKWIEGLIPLSAAAPFHPNAKGEAAMAAAVEAALG
jgi:lysophospholipase L1-like esterase